MIGLELIVILSSIFCIYQALTFLNIWNAPYISLLANQNVYFTIVKVCVLKWSIIIGVFGIIYALVSIFLFSKNADLMRYRIITTVFYLVITLFLLF